MKTKVTIIVDINNSTHCNNNCEYMYFTKTEVKCRLYNYNLEWDKRYKKNGYKRCERCKTLV